MLSRYCESVHPNPYEGAKAGCTRCRLYVRNSRFRKVLDGQKVAAKGGAGEQRTGGKLRLDCVHRGDVIRKLAGGCGACTVYVCGVHKECLLTPRTGVKAAAEIQVCLKCDDYTPPSAAVSAATPVVTATPVVATPTLPVGVKLLRKFDEHTLWPGVPGRRFNSSLLPWNDGYLFAARNGWRGSDIYVGRLDAHLNPHGEPVRLGLWHEHANYGREDPRLFLFNGKPHVAYIGVVGGKRIRHTNVLYARLSPDTFHVEQVYATRYPRRNLWEKNWQFFEHDGKLYAVYSIAPHKILAIDGERAELAYETHTPAVWQGGGELRGGTPPVRVGDEYVSFFHSRSAQEHRNGRQMYQTGAYAFQATPPFAVTRITPRPVMVADPHTCPKDQYCDVVFTCGAVKHGAEWVVSSGVHDRWTEIHGINAAELEGQLVPVQNSAVEFARGIQGWMSEEELHFLADTASKLPEGARWAEIGVWKGRSLAAVALSVPNGGKVLAVDSWEGSPDERETTQKEILEGNEVLNCFRETARQIQRQRPDILQRWQPRDSVKAATEYGDGVFNVVFIDGAHDYASVAADIKAWRPKVMPGGLLMGHDRDFPGVKQALAESGLPVQRGPGSIWYARMPVDAKKISLPPTYCITCPQSGRVPVLSIPATMFQGIHGRTWGLRTAIPAHPGVDDYYIPPGHVGLNLSHWMLWQHCLLSGHEEVLILEDDCRLEPDFVDKFWQAYQSLPADWQLVYLGTVGTEGKDRQPVAPGLVTVDQPFGTHCYLVRRSALPVLLERCQEAREHIDTQMFQNAVRDYLRYYVAWPSLAGQRSYEGTWVGTCG